MRGAFGFLKWTPETFWVSTITEYMAAVEGHNEALGGKKKIDGPSGDQMDELLKRYG